MHARWALICGASVVVAIAATAQGPTTATSILNKVGSTYRSAQTYKGTSTIEVTDGEDRTTMPVTLAVQRPNKYLLEVEHPRVGSRVVSDGATFTAFRTQRNAYTTGQSPARLMGANFLTGIDVPSPAARIITLAAGGLLAGNDPLAQALAKAEVVKPSSGGQLVIDGQPVHMLAFRYDTEHVAQMLVGASDYQIKRVELIKDGLVEVRETLNEVEINKPIADATFNKPIPEGARIVFTLPTLDSAIPYKGPAAPTFTGKRLDGVGKLNLSELKGKVVVLNFWFNDCPPCIAEAPSMAKLYDRLKDKGLEIVAINGTDSADAAASWLKEYGLNVTGVASDREQKIEKLFKIDAYPTNIVIDRGGRMVARIVGYNSKGDDRLEKALAKLNIQ